MTRGLDPRAFHRRLPGYAPTPLHDAPTLAAPLGLARVTIKDESSRLGLPSFKILGASWATYRLLVSRLGHEPAWRDLDELRATFAPLGALTLVAATDVGGPLMGSDGAALGYAAQKGADRATRGLLETAMRSWATATDGAAAVRPGAGAGGGLGFGLFGGIGPVPGALVMIATPASASAAAVRPSSASSMAPSA